MKRWSLAVVVGALPWMVTAQDAVKAAPEHYKVVFDNDAVRVLRIEGGPGEKIAMHEHPDAVLVPLGAAKVRFTMPDGRTEDADIASEAVAYTPAVKHAPANVGSTPIQAVLVEIKEAAGTATLPASRPGIAQTLLAEGPRASAYRASAAADFHEPAGTTHDYDQVVIALGAGDVALSLEGKAARSRWQRGDVQFVGRGVKHEARNTGGKPLDYIIVAIR
jgi:mannose-6-phosphate isomerase-like protein (cupin superfamily)